MKKSILIIGASRGIGFGLAEDYAVKGWDVTATIRQPRARFSKAIAVDTVDINDLKAVDAFVTGLKSKQFDIVFINAGITGPTGKSTATVDEADIGHLFMTNAVSPIRLGEKLLENVKPQTGILAFMSSILGSISLGSGDFAPLYSASKSALNQLTRSFASKINKNITVLSLHPGWVKTDMGGAGADIDVVTSVKGLTKVLDSKAGSLKHEYLDYQGKTIPW